MGRIRWLDIPTSIDIPNEYHPSTSHLPLTEEERRLLGEYEFLKKFNPDMLRTKIKAGYFPNSRLLTDDEIADKRMYYKKYVRNKRLEGDKL